MLINKNSKIFIAGHNGMVGSAILRYLKKKKFKKIITIEKKKINLLNYQKVNSFLKKIKPDIIFLAAAKVGGIKANNDFPYNFLYENLVIQNNVIHSAYLNNIKKLVFIGSSCMYPKFSIQPIKEDYLLSSKLEKTNEGYALAKICGLKLCEYINKQFNSQNYDYRTFVPCNLYGLNDNYDSENSHVIPALIRKIYLAKKNNISNVIIWGTGKPKREFLYVDDLAEIVVRLSIMSKKKILSKIKNKYSVVVNIGSGQEITIGNLANLIKKIIKYKGKLIFNNELDGTPRKVMDLKIINSLKIRNKTKLFEGLVKTINFFKKKNNNGKSFLYNHNS
jgi:GDP-L-fucose synthase